MENAVDQEPELDYLKRQVEQQKKQIRGLRLLLKAELTGDSLSASQAIEILEALGIDLKSLRM